MCRRAGFPQGQVFGERSVALKLSVERGQFGSCLRAEPHGGVAPEQHRDADQLLDGPLSQRGSVTHRGTKGHSGFSARPIGHESHAGHDPI